MKIVIGLALLAAPAALMAQTVTKCRTDPAGNLICESQQQTEFKPDWGVGGLQLPTAQDYIDVAEAARARAQARYAANPEYYQNLWAEERRRKAFKLIVKGKCQKAEDYAFEEGDMALVELVQSIRLQRNC